MQKILGNIKLKVRTKYKKEKKEMRRTKQGVSLIVLVITIIIMIILASAIIVTLSNSDIIDRANEAVQKTDLQEVQNIASIAWTEAYLDGKTTKAELKTAVENALTKNKVDKSKYTLDVTKKGVKVYLVTTLGEVITNPVTDYGKTVDYTVTVDGTTYDDWQVYYEDEKNGYVFLITKNIIGNNDETSHDGSNSFSTSTYSKFQVGDWDKFDKDKTGVDMFFYLTTSFDDFANRTYYGENVIAAIGAPTLELFAAGYNAKHNTNAMKLIIDLNYEDTIYNDDGEETGYMHSAGYEGYYINSKGSTRYPEYPNKLEIDGIYITGEDQWLATGSPVIEYDGSHYMYGIFNNSLDGSIWGTYDNLDVPSVGIRPVICLSSDTPASIGTETDYTLVVK